MATKRSGQGDALRLRVHGTWSPLFDLFAQSISPGIFQINGELSYLLSSLPPTISFGQSQPPSLGFLLRSGSSRQPWMAALPALDQPPRCSGAMRQVCFGSKAVIQQAACLSV